MRTTSLLLATIVTAQAHAEKWNFTLLLQSTAHQAMVVSYPLAGSFIGNYNATTNPTGTRTIPGLFGGSGNQPIPYTSVMRTEETVDSSPAGTFALEVRPGGICEITNFSSDLIHGTPGSVALEMDITYSNFHTAAPDAIFPSVGMITIPLATGSVDVATATQAGPAIGTVVPDGTASSTVTVAVPVMVNASGTAGGQPYSALPTPAVMAITGTLTINGTTAIFSATSSATEPIGPLPPPAPIVDQPMALPTVIPAGSTANLLLSGTFGEGSGTSTFNISIAAAGVPAAIPGDINGDGIVDGVDMTALLSAWGATGSPADLDGDGVVGGTDLTVILSYWSH